MSLMCGFGGFMGSMGLRVFARLQPKQSPYQVPSAHEIIAVLLRRNQRERDSKHMELWLMRYWAYWLRVYGLCGLCGFIFCLGNGECLATDGHRFTRIVFVWGLWAGGSLRGFSRSNLHILVISSMGRWFDGARVFMP